MKDDVVKEVVIKDRSSHLGEKWSPLFWSLLSGALLAGLAHKFIGVDNITITAGVIGAALLLFVKEVRDRYIEVLFYVVGTGILIGLVWFIFWLFSS